MYKRLSRFKKLQGAALVEFAIVLPFFLAVIVGVTELGLFFIQDNTLNKSVREASRYLARNIGLEGCYTNIATGLIADNMTSMFPSGYADFNTLTDTITLEQLCVNESNGAIVGSAQTIASGSCNIAKKQCVADPAAPTVKPHLHIRVSARFGAEMVFLQGMMGFNFQPMLAASSIMRVQSQL